MIIVIYIFVNFFIFNLDLRMSTPPFPMRNILHTKALKFLYFALFSSAAVSGAYFTFYTVPRFRKYEEYFE